MTFQRRLTEIGEGDEDKKRAEDCEMSPDMEAEAEKRRCRANSDDTAKKGKKGQAFTGALLLSFNFKPFSSPTALTQVASTTLEEYISCLCGRVSHCLVLWTSVDFFLYIVCLPGSAPICPSACLRVSTCLSACHIISMMTLAIKLTLMPCITPLFKLQISCFIKAPLLSILYHLFVWLLCPRVFMPASPERGSLSM